MIYSIWYVVYKFEGSIEINFYGLYKDYTGLYSTKIFFFTNTPQIKWGSF